MLRTKPGSTLTEKEKIFCEEYILDLNAAHAAMRAGYSEDSAASTGYHLKQRPEVEAYIDQILYERELRSRITVDQILLELAKIGFAEPEDANEANELTAPETKPEETKPTTEKPGASRLEKEALSYIGKMTREKDRAPKPTASSMYKIVHFNTYTGRTTTVQFNLSAKIAALKLLGRHLGLFLTAAKAMVPKPNVIFPPVRQVVLH